MTDSSRYHMPIDPTNLNNPHSLELELVGTGHRILELGCATGHVTEQFVANGNTVVGVEIDPDAAPLAGQWAERVHTLDLDFAPITTVENEKFDVIVAGDVLEHLRDSAKVLGELLDVLEPNGRVIISVPNVAHFDIRMMLLEGNWTYQETGLLDRTHLRWFTRPGLQQLLRDAGLVATRVRRVTRPQGWSRLPIHPELHSPSLIEFIEADPEAYTFQFVVEAQRVSEVAADHVDPLEADAIPWPAPDAALRAQLEASLAANADLQAQLDAYRNSHVNRAVEPLRKLRNRARG